VSGIFQKCIEPEEGQDLLKDIHQGECGHHASSRALVAKAFRHGFYWPTALQDADQLVKHCNGCQRFSKHRHTLAAALKTIPLTWPFPGVIAIFWPNKEMGRNQDGLGGWIGLARGFGLNCPCICIIVVDYV
jgi:hypothetical protein